MRVGGPKAAKRLRPERAIPSMILKAERFERNVKEVAGSI